jgi:hypothetical protein
MNDELTHTVAATNLREAVNEVMHHQFTHSRPAMHALQDLINAADAAADEIERCAEARRDDAREIAELRGVLHELVRVYVRDGAATTPARAIGDAWAAAQRVLMRA